MAKPQGSEIDKQKIMTLYGKGNYRVFGSNKHSAIKPCHWQEQKLLTGRENRNCYKGYFGIESHLCIQNTPSLPFCNHQCVFCWRDIEHASFGPVWRGKMDSPKVLVNKMISHTENLIFEHITKERSLENLEIMKQALGFVLKCYKNGKNYNFEFSDDRLSKETNNSLQKTRRALVLLKNMDVLENQKSGHYTVHEDIQKEIKNSKEEGLSDSQIVEKIIARDVTTKEDIEKVFEEAKHPKHAAISLAGEPTLYPKIGELVQEFRSRGFTTFIVTNGTNPGVIRDMWKSGNLPTQLYVTLPAPTRKDYLKICKPLIKDGWERLMETISLLPKLPCRTIVRITSVKYININFDQVEKYAAILKENTPDFIDIKGFTVQADALRLVDRWEAKHDLRDYRPSYQDLLVFSTRLEEATGFPIIEASETSVDILLRGKWPADKSIVISEDQK